MLFSPRLLFHYPHLKHICSIRLEDYKQASPCNSYFRIRQGDRWRLCLLLSRWYTEITARRTPLSSRQAIGPSTKQVSECVGFNSDGTPLAKLITPKLKRILHKRGGNQTKTKIPRNNYVYLDPDSVLLIFSRRWIIDGQ